MTEYIVKVEEKFIHTLTVTANNSDEASEMAYQMLRNGLSDEGKSACDYSLEPFEFTGEWVTEEVA